MQRLDIFFAEADQDFRRLVEDGFYRAKTLAKDLRAENLGEAILNAIGFRQHLDKFMPY